MENTNQTNSQIQTDLPTQDDLPTQTDLPTRQDLSSVKKSKEFKESKVFVKSNKGKKIELKNLDEIKQIELSGELDEWVGQKLSEIKNHTFKNNVFDVGAKQIVSSVRLVKTSKLGRTLTPMIWEYYKNRGNLDVNQVIKEYKRENLIIHYSLNQQKKNSNCGVKKIPGNVSQDVSQDVPQDVSQDIPQDISDDLT